MCSVSPACTELTCMCREGHARGGDRAARQHIACAENSMRTTSTGPKVIRSDDSPPQFPIVPSVRVVSTRKSGFSQVQHGRGSVGRERSMIPFLARLQVVVAELVGCDSPGQTGRACCRPGASARHRRPNGQVPPAGGDGSPENRTTRRRTLSDSAPSAMPVPGSEGVWLRRASGECRRVG